MNAVISDDTPGHEHETLASFGVQDTCRGSDDDFAIHERAADVMIQLRKKGILAHLEKHVDAAGEHVDVVKDLSAGAPAPPGE
jgi:hypothetical protein